jgi:hypothetical protein
MFTLATIRSNPATITLILALLLLLPDWHQKLLPFALGSRQRNNELFAQEPRYSYRVYQDRKEGIVPQRTLVAGEKLVLVSAELESNEAARAQNTPQYKLAFYLRNGTKKISLVVREPKKRYKMEPLRREYPAGFNSFAWSSEIPRFYDITIHDLAPLAESADLTGEFIVPVVLFSTSVKPATLQYRFGIVPLQTISVLEYKIYPPNSLQAIYAAKLRDLHADEEACLRWHGKDQNNMVVKDGRYQLTVEATFKALPGESAKQTYVKYVFYHHAEALLGNWNMPQ